MKENDFWTWTIYCHIPVPYKCRFYLLTTYQFAKSNSKSTPCRRYYIIFFFYFVYDTFVYLFIHVFILFTFFLQFFDHPVIIDLLTDWWCGGYKNRKLSRLWWFLLTVWCLFDIVLFPLIFLLTCVMGKVTYFLEFVDISFSLRANSPGRYGGGAGKGRRACNYVSGIWISASKNSMRNAYWPRWMSNEVISPGTSFSMFVYIHARFRFALNGGNFTARSDGELRGELEVELKFQRVSCNLSFLFPPRHQSVLENLLAGYFSLNVDNQIFSINDCGPWIYKAFLVDVLVLVFVLFSFHFIYLVLTLFSASVTSRSNWT